LVLDEPKENDQTYSVEKIEFLMSGSTSRSLNRFNSDVLIDYVEDMSGKGFKIRLKERARKTSDSISR
jgi:Fe-S cluster assembly iron-binding protein IscA